MPHWIPLYPFVIYLYNFCSYGLTQGINILLCYLLQHAQTRNYHSQQIFVECIGLTITVWNFCLYFCPKKKKIVWYWSITLLFIDDSTSMPIFCVSLSIFTTTLLIIGDIQGDYDAYFSLVQNIHSQVLWTQVLRSKPSPLAQPLQCNHGIFAICKTTFWILAFPEKIRWPHEILAYSPFSQSCGNNMECYFQQQDLASSKTNKRHFWMNVFVVIIVQLL